ncbi:MAG: hypothetical protein JWO30_417 [Fibrobacteres bacterium]|nr:hypothetical protein [Fibrobacterota bacterium]
MELRLNTKRIRIDLEEKPDYLLFFVTGEYNLEDFKILVQGCRDECVRAGFVKAMVDIREVLGDIPNFERHTLGQMFAEVWGGRLRAGILSPRDRVNKLFENTAVNRYAQVMVHNEEQKILDWLSAP